MKYYNENKRKVRTNNSNSQYEIKEEMRKIEQAASQSFSRDIITGNVSKTLTTTTKFLNTPNINYIPRNNNNSTDNKPTVDFAAYYNQKNGFASGDKTYSNITHEEIMKFAGGEDKLKTNSEISDEPIIPYDINAPIIDENTGISKWETVSVKKVSEINDESTPVAVAAAPKINTSKNIMKFEKISKPRVEEKPKPHLDSDEEDEDKYLAKYGHSSLIRQPETENVRDISETEHEKVSFSFKKRKHNITAKSTSVGIE